MIEHHDVKPPVTEDLKTYEFSSFRPEMLDGLDNWELVEFEPHKRWLLKHKEFHTTDNSYGVEITKVSYPVKGGERSQATFEVGNASGYHYNRLPDIRKISVGRVGIGLQGEKEVVRFLGVNKKALEIRNDGSVIGIGTDSSLVPFSKPQA